MRTIFVALALAAASLVQAQERTLSWKSLDVTAKLANDGTLRVSERHRMLFNGDWNGGQRDFRIEPDQQFTLTGMSRITTKEKKIPLTEARGEGVALGEYRLDGTTLRWRARDADDPPFRNKQLTYVIEYELRNVVAREGEKYVLDHDFAFADRPGPIEEFSAELQLDSEWQAPADFASRYERTNLPEGEGAVLKVELQHTGATAPQFVVLPPPPPAPEPAAVAATPRPAVPAKPPAPPVPVLVKLAMFVGFVAVAMLMTILFQRREQEIGRYEPPPHVTPEWLEQNLLVHRAEVVGAAWDGQTGPGEVAALIAILTSEGKIANVPGAPRLRLLVQRDTLSPYERGFIDALFINGNDIDPETLRQHYRYTGFQPAQTIAAPLQAAAQGLVGDAPRSAWAMGCLWFFCSIVFFPIIAIAFLITLILGAMYRDRFMGRAMASALPMPILVAGLFHTAINDSAGWLLANLGAGLVLLFFALWLARWNREEHELRNLRNFIAAREFLWQWIARGEPHVDPRWIPYMLAFGLLPHDRWSVAAPPPPPPMPQQQVYFNEYPQQHQYYESAPPSYNGAYGGGYGSPAGEGGAPPLPPFEPGGGRFGGAGATGSWASIQTFANAVAATPPRPVRTVSSSGGWSNRRTSGSGWSWSSGGSSSSSSSSSRSSSSSSSRSSSSGSRSSSSSSSSRGGGGSRSGGGGGGGW